MVCSRCGTAAPEGARFCASCGHELATIAPREERKFVSILFVDMVGSTASADGADPEDVRERNQLYYEVVRESIERFGGAVEKYVGDGVVSVFGAPLARSDDAERAVRASLSDPGWDPRAERAAPRHRARRAGRCHDGRGDRGPGRGARGHARDGRRREHRGAAAERSSTRPRDRRRPELSADASRVPFRGDAPRRGEGQARARSTRGRSAKPSPRRRGRRPRRRWSAATSSCP